MSSADLKDVFGLEEEKAPRKLTKAEQKAAKKAQKEAEKARREVEKQYEKAVKNAKKKGLDMPPRPPMLDTTSI